MESQFVICLQTQALKHIGVENTKIQPNKLFILVVIFSCANKIGLAISTNH
jgi:hypothetical protein